MRRVGLLAYYFPPLGGAGVQRAAKLVDQLPEFGWRPVVVTGPGRREQRWTPQDETLDRSSADVRRVRGPEPGPGGRAERWLRSPSPWARWWTREAHDALATLDVDVILATLSPFEGARAALAAAAERRIPCVLDLRDPWALDEMVMYPTRLHREAELRAMRAALTDAHAVVMNTREAASAVVRTWPELAGKCVTIPNGFDPADFDVEPEKRSDDALRIVHTGYLHTELEPGGISARIRRLAGGALDGVDVGARSHVRLIDALDRVDGKVELHLAGLLSPADVAAADRPYVHLRGYLPHRESVALAKSADALFLPMHDLPRGTRARIVPGKAYEYLGAARPILAAVPDGDARDLLEQTGNAILVRPNDLDGMVAAVLRLLAGDGPAAAPARAVVAEYDRRALAQRLAATLDRVCEPQVRSAAA